MLKSILDRRSIRSFTDKPVSQEDVRTLLECAMHAPSARDGRPWRFIVIDERATLDALAERHPYAAMLRQAPLCICVCAVEGEIAGYYQQDCAAATMNILIAAKETGLGTCWMGVAPREERMADVRDVLSIPEDIAPFNLIAVGYPATERARPARWDESLIHKNRW
ncbi:MAG: nitroreductase family protein [Christensenellales bacterium]|jgi:nitroreductase